LAVALVGSGARAAGVGCAVAPVVVAAARRAELRAALARRRRPAGPAAAAAAAVAAALVAGGPVGERLASAVAPAEAGGRGRLDEWRVAGRVVADPPVLGGGPEGYRVAFATGVDAAYERAHGRGPQPDRAHSTPLDVALAGGLP